MTKPQPIVKRIPLVNDGDVIEITGEPIDNLYRIDLISRGSLKVKIENIQCDEIFEVAELLKRDVREVEEGDEFPNLRLRNPGDDSLWMFFDGICDLTVCREWTTVTVYANLDRVKKIIFALEDIFNECGIAHENALMGSPHNRMFI